MDNIKSSISKIVRNLEQRGFERYDPQDIRNYKFDVPVIIYRYWRYLFCFLETLFPILIRVFLGINKKKVITAYVHVSEALLLTEQNLIFLSSKLNSIDLCEEGLNEYCIEDKETLGWPYNKSDSGLPILAEKENIDSTMPMHGLARFNILLLKIGLYYHNERYIDIAFRTAMQVMKIHTIKEYEDGLLSISYYNNTDDCTLNVNTEFAQWISLIPSDLQNESTRKMMNGIVRLMLYEQNEDGSWYYFSKKFMRDNGFAPSVDCHHTGTVLSNLIYVLKSPILELGLHKALRMAIYKGLSFYIRELFDVKTGKAKELIGYRRLAGPVQYSEAIFAFYEYLLSEDTDEELKNDILLLFPKVINQIIRLIKSDGSVPSECVLKWVNYDSIRWGNGPALQALIAYEVLLKKGVFAK